MRALARDGLRVVVGLWLLMPIAAARGQDAARRIALVNPGAELERAARTALEPWSVQIAVIDGAPPGATAPRNSAAARALALAHGAAAVVWVSEHELGHAIWVYDLDTDQLLARPLAFGLPFDGPTAAAVALSVKTLLRHSEAAPAAERFGAAAPLPAPAVPREDRTEPPQTRPGAPAMIVDAAPDDDGAAAPRATGSTLDFEAAFGLRLGLTRPSHSEARVGVGAFVWPGAGAIGLGLRAAMGPGVHVATQPFDGRLLDIAPGLGTRVRLPLARPIGVTAGAFATAHVTVLDGTLGGADMQSVVRFVPSLDLELQVEVALAPFLKVGARGGALLWLRPQRYLVLGQSVLELSRSAFEAGLTLVASLPD